MFSPSVGQEIEIGGIRYRFAKHPSAPGMVFGQEGRQAVVYLVESSSGPRHALKVFKPRYRVPALVSLSQELASLSAQPGLQVCERLILGPRRNAPLLSQWPDLSYAALMPWIEGPTWMQVLLDKRELSREQSLALAQFLAEALMEMEERGIAHCDLSAANVMLPLLATTAPSATWGVELVDVEQLFGPQLPKSLFVSSGSPGYAHPHVPAGLWGPTADRFAGAVLLAEMLCWCDRRARDAAWGESFFDPSELQSDCQRYQLMRRSVQALWGKGAAGFLVQAWEAERLDDCPTFGEWRMGLPATVGEAVGEMDEPVTLPAKDDEESLREGMEESELGLGFPGEVADSGLEPAPSGTRWVPDVLVHAKCRQSRRRLVTLLLLALAGAAALGGLLGTQNSEVRSLRSEIHWLEDEAAELRGDLAQAYADYSRAIRGDALIESFPLTAAVETASARDSDGAWYPDTEEARWWEAHGQLYVIVKKPSTLVALPLAEPASFDNFSIDVDVTRTGGQSAASLGVRFCEAANGNALDFMITPELGQYALRRRTSSGWQGLASGGHYAVNGGGATSHLTVVRDGSEFSFLVNGIVVYRREIGSASSGRISLTAQSPSGGGASAAFDNVVIQKH